MSVVSLPSHHPYSDRPLSFRTVRDRLHELTHRHLFLRSLVLSISNLDYGFLVPGNTSLSKLGELEEISIAVEPSEREDWLVACQTSAYVKEFRQRNKNGEDALTMRFHDEVQLKLRLVSQFSYRQKKYISITEVLNEVLIHRDGIKIAAARHAVEYHWLKSHEQVRKFSTDFRPLFLARAAKEQIEVAEYICHKYRLESHRLFHLLTHTPVYRKSIDICMGLDSARKYGRWNREGALSMLWLPGLRLLLS